MSPITQNRRELAGRNVIRQADEAMGDALGFQFREAVAGVQLLHDGPIQGFR